MIRHGLGILYPQIGLLLTRKRGVGGVLGGGAGAHGDGGGLPTVAQPVVRRLYFTGEGGVRFGSLEQFPDLLRRSLLALWRLRCVGYDAVDLVRKTAPRNELPVRLGGHHEPRGNLQSPV